VYSPLIVAVSSTAVAGIAFMLYGISFHPALLAGAFLVTMGVYTFNVVTDRGEDAVNMPEREAYFLSDTNHLLAVALGAYGGALVLGATVSLFAVPVLLVPLILGILYSTPVGAKRLKDYLVGKNVTVSLSFGMEAALLPAVLGFDWLRCGLVFSFIFVKGMVNTVVFDTRDVAGDAAVGVDTIPVRLGVGNTKLLLLALNSLLVPWLLMVVHFSMFILYLPVLVFSVAYSYFYILYLCRGDRIPKSHYGFLVDGEMIVLFVLFALTAFLAG